jgi:hypothetical protein
VKHPLKYCTSADQVEGGESADGGVASATLVSDRHVAHIWHQCRRCCA